MATHSSVLAWRIPGTGEPGGLPSTGSHRVRHDWSDLAAAAATVIKNPPASAGDVRGMGLIPDWRRPPGEGNGNPLQCSCQENHMNRGAWWAIGSQWVGHDWSDLAFIHSMVMWACKLLLPPRDLYFSGHSTSFSWLVAGPHISYKTIHQNGPQSSVCLPSLSVMSDSLWPYELQPTRLCCTWGFPGRNTEWVAISSSWPRNQTCVSCISFRFFTTDHLESPSAKQNHSVCEWDSQNTKEARADASKDCRKSDIFLTCFTLPFQSFSLLLC